MLGIGFRPNAGRSSADWRAQWLAMLCCTPMLVLLPAVAPGQARKAHVFHGTVQRVDVGARTVTVDGENVEGWMAAMSVTYHVDKPDVLSRVKPGGHRCARYLE